jgi:lipopolysaccharide heptosyltransferase II
MIPPNPQEVHRILIRANNWIGDVVMISPAVRAIREHFQRARVAILAKRWVLDALGGNPYYDDLVEYDHTRRHAGLSGRLQLAAELRRAGRIDVAILFQKAFDAAAIAWLAAARERVGHATDRRSLLLTSAVPLPPAGTHHVDVFLGLARSLGCPVRDRQPFFHLSPADRERAAARAASAGLAAAPLLVALHAGASKAPRAWSADRFAALAQRLCRRHGAALLLMGDAGDTVVLRRIAEGLPPRSLLALPEDGGLRDSAALLERCHLFVGNDSGPMHLSAALGVPTLGIFGPGSPRATGPIGPEGRVAVIGRDYPCSPCRQDFFRECPPAPSGKPFCLEEIEVEEVESAALALLRGARQPTRSEAGEAPAPEQASPPQP